MSMSTSVYGFTPPDATWRKHKAVYDACEQAGVAIPEETSAFFNHSPPDDSGVQIDLVEEGAAFEYSANMQGGYEVDLALVPASVKTIRFVNSW